MRFINHYRDVVLFLVATAMLLLYVALAGGGFALDDSWIHQTYARNLAQLGEWAFIPGQQSAGSSAPLYTVVLTAGYVLGMPHALWSHAMGALTLASAGIIGARMTEQIAKQHKTFDIEYAPLVVGLAIVLTWHHIWAAASGMETMLFSMLTLWLIFLGWRELDVDNSQSRFIIIRGAIFGLSVALTTLARPEGIVLGGLVGLLMLLVRPQGSIQKLLIYGGSALVAFAIMISPYLLLNLQLTGGLLPNTAAAKFEYYRTSFSVPFFARLQNMFVAIMAGGQALLLLGVVAYLVVLSHKRQLKTLLFLLPLLWAIGLLVLYAVRLPVWFQHGRYQMPALPSIVWMGALGTVLLVKWGHQEGKLLIIRRVLVRVLALSAAGTILAFAFGIGTNAYVQDVAVIDEEMVASAHWIVENIPQEDLLAIHDIGAVGYFSGRDDMLDVAGLISPEVIDIVSDGDALWQWMEAEGATYFMGFDDQIPNDDPNDPRLCRVFITEDTTSIESVRPKMAIYRLAYDENCPT